ncbi:unnamed protein product, partial [Strongylus vulgaris]
MDGVGTDIGFKHALYGYMDRHVDLAIMKPSRRNVQSTVNTGERYRTIALANAAMDLLEKSYCEKLTKQASFTDSSCGIINANDDGVLNLSTFPEPREKTTFCQWLLESSDPWARIEVSIERLGLDGEDVRPG